MIILSSIAAWLAAHWVSIVVGTTIAAAALAVANAARPLIESAIVDATRQSEVTIVPTSFESDQGSGTVFIQDKVALFGLLDGGQGDFTADLTTYYRFIVFDPVRWTDYAHHMINQVSFRNFKPEMTKVFLMHLLQPEQSKISPVLTPMFLDFKNYMDNIDTIAERNFFVYNRNLYAGGLLRMQLMEEGQGG